MLPRKSNVRIAVRNLAGEVIQQIETHNLVVNDRLVRFRDWFASQSLTNNSLLTADYIAVGTGTAPVLATDTILGTEIFRKQVSRRFASGPYSIQFYLNIETTEANGNTLTEVGLFTAAVGGTCWNRALHTAIVKTSSISIIYEITLVFGAV